MANLLTYKGYQGTVEFDMESKVLHGKILFINDLITYEADTITDLENEFKISVDDYLETCNEIGKEPDKPFSGTLNIRIGEERHKNIAKYSVEKDISINHFIINAIDEHIKLKQTEKLREIKSHSIQLYQSISHIDFSEFSSEYKELEITIN